jgi:hypothetical protein
MLKVLGKGLSFAPTPFPHNSYFVLFGVIFLSSHLIDILRGDPEYLLLRMLPSRVEEVFILCM